MTELPAAAIPAGWYADATTPGLMRWWDGTTWTEHTAAAVSVAPYTGAVAERPQLPADRPIYSPFIWLIVLLPLVSLLLFLVWQPDVRYTDYGVGGTPRVDPSSIYTPTYFLSGAVGWLIYGLLVFFAYRDVVWLKRQGVVRPFHWAWAFLSSLVYVIGRSVIVHRVAAPRGRSPIWVAIGVLVLGFIVGIAWTASLMSEMMNQVGLNR
jgi:hypothetical protein